MARIPEEELERLKREVSIERLCEARGIDLARHGADLVGKCPWHDDSTPSLVITKGTNLWHCLGACQAGGSVIDWVMRAESVSFRHAVELLREGYPSLAASARDGKAQWSRKLSSPVAAAADDGAILSQVVDFYHETLKTSPEALAYLERRAIKSDEAIGHFKLGYANRTLGLRLPIKAIKEGERMRARLAALGVLRESGHEHLAGSLVMPILSPAGEVLGMYGRKIVENLRPGTPKHLYLPGPHRGVWNEPSLIDSKEIILCEALIDALTFWCAGFRNVTTSWGVNGFTEDHEQAFKKHGTKRILIAYDRDEAGEKAAEALVPRLMDLGLEVFRVQFPKGMDANEYALKVTPAAKSLGLAIRKASWLGRGPAPARETAAAKEEKQRLEEGVAPAEVFPEPLESPPCEVSSLAAAVVPEMPGAPPRLSSESSLEVELKGDEAAVAMGDRKWRVRGLAKNTSFEQLRVNVLVAKGESFHVDTLDLYSAKQRASFATLAAAELGVEPEVVKKDLGRLLMKLEGLHEEALKKTLEPKRKAAAVGEKDSAAAMDLLRSPDLLERILKDFEKAGVVGEETNKLVGYLAALSRKLDEPLAIVIQSSSAAGKSSLMDAVLAFVPDEERIKYSAMTGQSLFYVGEEDLAHKILAIVEEQGASRASYSLKLLQSEGELSIASTGKDPATGRLVTHEYRVKGPVMIFLTTTAPEIDEELLNRCIVLTVDEEREQTRAIHKLQRERQTLEGLLAKQDRSELLAVHQNAQRLLRPLLVANPFARELTFIDDRTRTRRDHVKYLTLIRTIALLHQHQRPAKKAAHGGRDVEYIEASLADVAIANALAHQVLGRSLDELPPQTRRLLTLLDRFVAEKSRQLKMERSDYRFTRREARAWTVWGDTQLRLHLGRLVELEYVLVHHGSRGQSFVYELVYDGRGEDGAPFLPGLIETSKLGVIPANLAGFCQRVAGSSRPHRAPSAGGSRGVENDGDPELSTTSEKKTGKRLEIALLAPANGASYSKPLPSLAARISAGGE
ncbi:MAG: hypothetical protein FD180_4742 [Planctomycetota bacterium]|nr:MAG: hypothetical protein FD180_4742 [Planctomycetota bacterium]